MIVQCRHCHMRYDLDEQVLGSKGCHVRCTNCGHIWHQAPLPQRNALVAQSPHVDSTSSVTMPPSPLARSWSLRILMGMLYVVVFVSGVYSPTWFKPWIQSWKELVCPMAQSAIVLELEKCQWGLGEDGQWHLKGQLRNRSDRDISDPDVIIEYTSIDAKTAVTSLQTKRHTCHDVRLLPNQSHEFHLMIPADRCADFKITLVP